MADRPKPVPKGNEVLVRIHATTVTAGDVRMRKADPFIIRFFNGFTKPKSPILGHELAGQVEATGPAVTKFQPGDWVFGATGLKSGTYADYMCVPEDGALALKPDNISCQEAASVPVGGLTALHFLRKGNIQSGQEVLIYGASGSIGTAAVQLAKHFGATVTGVCSTKNVERVRSLGADRVIDYKKEDFTKSGQIYDVIFDTVGKTSYSKSKDVLTDRGIFLSSGAGLGDYLTMLLLPLWSKKRIIAGLAGEAPADLELLRQLLESGQFEPVIDKTYSLKQMEEAHYYVDQGHKVGNVVIDVVG